MTHNHFQVGDRVMRVAPWTGDAPTVCIPIEVGAVHQVTEVLDKTLAFAADVLLLDDPLMWGGQYVRLDHPFFYHDDGTPHGWIHSNSLHLLAPKSVVDVVAFEHHFESPKEILFWDMWVDDAIEYLKNRRSNP